MSSRALAARALMLAATTLAGCIIPAPLERPDGQNQPAIDLDHTVPDPREPFSVPDGPGTRVELSLRVRDPDAQVLQVRLFVDRQYGAPLPLFNSTIPPAPTKEDGVRTHSVMITQLCDRVVGVVLGAHTLELHVSDTGFAEATGRAPGPGGHSDSIAWLFYCLPGVTVDDAGI